MTSARDEKLGWLVAWGEIRHLRRTYPASLPAGLLILHPFTTWDDEEVTWRVAADAVGVDLDTWLRTTPGDPSELHWPTGRPGDLQPPMEGWVPEAARQVLAESLGEMAAAPVTVGLYGGWGQPEGIQTDPVSIEVGELPYWLAHVEGPAFFSAWSEAGDDVRDWDNLVTFVWPEDPLWFLCTHPDLSYTEVYGDSALIARLEASSLETWRVEPRSFDV